MLRMAQNGNAAPVLLAASPSMAEMVKLSEAMAIYLRLKGHDRPIAFKGAPILRKHVKAYLCANRPQNFLGQDVGRFLQVVPD
ncbi:MAG: hypothetical protein OQK00_04245 [Rhodobacteraceae bacterium]|nr:hypothetical protein [Paracoccaceae bacterium]MCW9044485.1 hypothetical protein [Pseudopelagicola sp.]